MLGLRVVRGPDWKHGDQDGGPDHVGTVVGVDTTMAKVQWDMGQSSMYRAGNGAFDLRLFDGAPVGILHKNTACVCCEDVDVYGTLWRCSMCTNVNLCTLCYHDDKHNTMHPFERIDFPDAEPVKVAKRSSSQRSRSLGIYPNATVSRGPDWEYVDQDGGAGREGIVEDVVSYGQVAADRNGARVKWGTGKNNVHVYRVGCDGKVDLTCIEEAPGATYYPDHLAVLDVARFEGWDQSAGVLSVGDLVCVELSVQELKQVQTGPWTNRLEEIVGEIGEVEGFTTAGDVIVRYDDDSVTIDKAAVTGVPDHHKGDKVKVKSSKVNVKRLQHKHGGWEDEMEEVLGKTGTVSIVDKDGDVGVVFDDGKAFVFHPSCLISVEQVTDDSDDDTDDSDDDERRVQPVGNPDNTDSDSDGEGAATGLMNVFAGLVLLQALVEGEQGSNIRQAFIDAVQEGREADVRSLLAKDPDLKDLKPQGIPLLHLAAFKDFAGVVNALLDGNADIDAEDSKGNTPLMIAIFSGNTECALVLIKRGADTDHVNREGRTAMHGAAFKNVKEVLDMVLKKGCNPNTQDVVGDTPLHDAISERHDDTAGMLIAHPDVNVWLQNAKNFNPMHVACMKQHAFAVDKLLTREPQLAKTAKNDGFMPLHICAVNNHVNEASILLVKGKADVNARNINRGTPLILAAGQGYFDMVKLLLTYDADWTLKDVNGNTALHECMKSRRTNQIFLQLLGLRNVSEDMERIKIANFLYQHGAKLDVTNNAGQTPITCCPIETMRESVQDYASKNTPTKPEPRQARPRTARVAQEVFTTAKQKCHKCTTNDAEVKFQPCNHKVACTDCCFKYKQCPICNRDISKRVDKHNKVLDTGCVLS